MAEVSGVPWGRIIVRGRTPDVLAKMLSGLGLVDCIAIIWVAVYISLYVYFSWSAHIFEPYSDMIDLLDQLFQAQDRHEIWAYLLQPHNLHRIVWFNSLLLVDVEAFGGSGAPFMAVAALCLAGLATLVGREVWRASGGGTLVLPALALATVFSAGNAASISDPANTPHVHTAFFAVLALVVAESQNGSARQSGRWIMAAACAAAASFSLAVGLLLWPILALVAWRSGASRSALTTLIIGGVAFWTLYLAGQRPPDGAGLQPADVMRAAEYFVTYLGLPLVRGAPIPGRLIGAGLLVMSLWALIHFGFRETDRSRRLALGMILFSLGCAALAAIGRRDIAPGVDVPMRYTVLLAPLHVGLLILAAPRLVSWSAAHPRLFQAAAAIFASILLALQVRLGLVAASDAKVTLAVVHAFHRGERSPAMLQFVHPQLAHAEAVYAELRRRRLYGRWLNETAPGHGDPGPRAAR